MFTITIVFFLYYVSKMWNRFHDVTRKLPSKHKKKKVFTLQSILDPRGYFKRDKEKWAAVEPDRFDVGDNVVGEMTRQKAFYDSGDRLYPFARDLLMFIVDDKFPHTRAKKSILSIFPIVPIETRVFIPSVKVEVQSLKRDLAMKNPYVPIVFAHKFTNSKHFAMIEDFEYQDTPYIKFATYEGFFILEIEEDANICNSVLEYLNNQNVKSPYLSFLDVVSTAALGFLLTVKYS